MKPLPLVLGFALAAGSGLACAEPASLPVFRITGVAVDQHSGAPIPYCRMQVSESAALDRPNRSPGEQDGRQEDRGRRQLQSLPETEADAQGRFTLVVSHAGAWKLSGAARNYRRQAFEAHDGFSAAVVLSAAQSAAQIVLRLERDASVEGSVLDEAGEPVRDAEVTAEAQSRPERDARTSRLGNRRAGTARTDDRGHYELSGLAPGAYRLEVQARPWYAQTFSPAGRTNSASKVQAEPSLDVIYPTLWYPGVQDETAAEPLQLAGGEEREANFQLAPLPAARLVVPRTPLASSDAEPRPQRNTLLLRISPGATSLATLSAAGGNAQEFTGLQPGLYEIDSFGPDGQPDGEPREIRIVAGTSTLVDLSEAQRRTRVTLLSEGGDPDRVAQLIFTDPVSGRRIFEGGNGFGERNGMVVRNHEDQPRHVALPAGAWEVRLADGRRSYLTSLSGTGLTVRGATITVGEDPASLLVHLGRSPGTIQGRALLEGKPVLGAMVLLVPASLGAPDNLLQTLRAETNTDGSFTLGEIPPGKYILLAIAHGWQVQWQDAAALLPFLVHGVPVAVESSARLQQNLTPEEP